MDETDISGAFRYDEEGQQYIFNLNLSPLGSGEWTLRTWLDDGKTYEVDVSVRE